MISSNIENMDFTLKNLAVPFSFAECMKIFPPTVDINHKKPVAAEMAAITASQSSGLKYVHSFRDATGLLFLVFV